MGLVLGHALEAECICPCAPLDLVQRSDNVICNLLLLLWHFGIRQVVREDLLEVTPVVDGVRVQRRCYLVGHVTGVVLISALSHRPVADSHRELVVAGRIGHCVCVHASLGAHLCIAIPVLLHLGLGGLLLRFQYDFTFFQERYGEPRAQI